jgi:hypothetical protein
MVSAIAAPLEKIDLPRNASHPEQDARHAIENGDLGFIGVYDFAYNIPEVEGLYRYHLFSKSLYAQLKVIRGTSDVHAPSADDFDMRAIAYAKRYNRVLLDWIEKHHRDWLGPRER